VPHGPYKKIASQNPRFCVSRSRVKRPNIPGWRNRNRSHAATRHTKSAGFPGYACNRSAPQTSSGAMETRDTLDCDLLTGGHVAYCLANSGPQDTVNQ